MSYSASRRRALDSERPLPHRASHARSCAARVSEKFRVHRDEVFARVRALVGVDMQALVTPEEIEAAIGVLDALRFSGLDDPPDHLGRVQGTG